MTRMPIPNVPKTATLDDASLISRTLTRAFDDDPMMRWFFPDDAARETALGRYFSTLFTRQYVHHGVCERTDAAAAFWVAPEAQAKAVPDADTTWTGSRRRSRNAPPLWSRREPPSVRRPVVSPPGTSGADLRQSPPGLAGHASTSPPSPPRTGASRATGRRTPHEFRSRTCRGR